MPHRWIQEVEGTKFDNYVDWMMMAYVFSLVDVPVLCLPCGMTADGRPVGLQIVGKPQGNMPFWLLQLPLSAHTHMQAWYPCSRW